MTVPRTGGKKPEVKREIFPGCVTLFEVTLGLDSKESGLGHALSSWTYKKVHDSKCISKLLNEFAPIVMDRRSSIADRPIEITYGQLIRVWCQQFVAGEALS